MSDEAITRWVIVACVAVLVLVGWLASRQSQECDAEGKVMVRGVIWYECVSR